jgi:hypothetical protein
MTMIDNIRNIDDYVGEVGGDDSEEKIQRSKSTTEGSRDEDEGVLVDNSDDLFNKLKE